jgi:hypothetical protein
MLLILKIGLRNNTLLPLLTLLVSKNLDFSPLMPLPLK